MKKYTKPEFNFYKFDIETSVMDDTPTPTPTMGVVYGSAVGTSAANVNQIPQNVTTKVYTEYGDGQDWNWTDK